MRSVSSWFRSLCSAVLQPVLPVPAAALLFVLCTLVTPALIHGQTSGDDLSRITRPWITVTVPSTAPGDTRSEVLAGVIADNLHLTLRLIGDYVVRPRPTVRTTPTDTAEAAAFAESEGLDYVVFGRVAELPDGGTLFSLSVYSREDGTVTLEREAVAATVFDTFDVADELAVDILGAFTGQRIAYGRIDLANLAEVPGEYLVYLDGEPVGTNVRVLERVLVGERLVEVVALEGPGAGRTMASERVLVGEGSREAVSFFFARPVVPEVPVEADHGDEMMAQALARLEEERRALSATTPETFMPLGTRVSVPVAEELFLSSGDYPDPEAIRAAALENTRIAADLQIGIGRRLLAGREYELGVLAHQSVTDLAGMFGRDDLFGYRNTVAAVNWNWSELTVQREVKPMPWLPVVVTAWALNLLIGNSFGEPAGVDYETDGVVTPSIPVVPFLMSVGLVGIWNSNDWSIPQHRRMLRRAGRNTEGAGVQPAGVVWQPHRWEIALGISTGILTGMGEGVIYDLPIPDMLIRDRDRDRGVSDLYYGVIKDHLAAVSLSVRHWLNRHNALQFNYIHYSDPFFSHAEVHPDPLDSRSPERDLDLLFGTMLSWVHTRTGRSLLEAGLSYHPIKYQEPSFGDSQKNEIEREFYRSLFGGEEFTMHVFGALLGVGWRFGAPPRRPWEFMVRYHLERHRFPGGVLGDQDPIWAHGLSASLSRSFGFGGDYDYSDTETRLADAPSRYTDISAARSAAEEKWQPGRLSLFVDPGGVLGWGPRFGLELHLSDRWSLSAWGRQYISESRFSPAGTLSRVYKHYEKLLIPESYVFPGIGLRRYVRDDGRGWYAGGLVELVSFNNLRAESSWEFDDRTVELDGRWVVPQLEGGYRMKIWRSLSLDAGVQAGLTLGNVDQVSYGGWPEEASHHEPWGSTEPWYNIVLSISTPLFTDVREHPIADTISAEVPGDDSSERAHGTVRETSPSLRPEVQVAGGTVLVGGFSYPIGAGGFELTLLGGVGQAQGLKVALAQRLTWTIPERRIAPRVSAYAVEVTDLGDIGIAAGPSVGVAFKLERFASAIVFDNAFVVNFRPFEPEYMVYMPSIGVQF